MDADDYATIYPNKTAALRAIHHLRDAKVPAFYDGTRVVDVDQVLPKCARCDGLGEVVVASHYVGGGTYNDHFDTCPRCNGSGHEPQEG